MSSTRQSTFFVSGQGIDREVITTDICRYLGNNALVRPGTHTDSKTGISHEGFFITAYRAPTREQLQNIRSDSTKWQEEKRKNAVKGGYVSWAATQKDGAEGQVEQSPQHSQMPYAALDRPPAAFPRQSSLYSRSQQPMPAGLDYSYGRDMFSQQSPPAGLGYGYGPDMFANPYPSAGLGYSYGQPNYETTRAGTESYRESNYFPPPTLFSESSSQQAKMSNNALITGGSSGTGTVPGPKSVNGSAEFNPSQTFAAPTGYATYQHNNNSYPSSGSQASSHNLIGDRNMSNYKYGQGTSLDDDEEEFYGDDEEMGPYDDTYTPEREDWDGDQMKRTREG